MRLGPEESSRYQAHILLKELGGPGQIRLKSAHAAIVGAGGLGGPAALYLAAAGFGRLTLIDPDTVSLSNLQRQILFDSAQIGEAKASAGAQRLAALNPHVAVQARRERLTPANAAALLNGVDIVLDGTDSFAARFAVNAACHGLGLPLVSGAVGRWEGQVGVFASGPTRGNPPAERAPCYRCFAPEAPPEAEPCAVQGIVGALTGIIGSMMALEAIKIIAGVGEPLSGRILFYDGLAGSARVARLRPDPDCPVCGARATPNFNPDERGG